jgi:hypothetical protein
MGALMAHNPSMTRSPELNAKPFRLILLSAAINSLGSVIVRGVSALNGPD